MKTNMHKEKGALEGILPWALGAFATVSLAFTSFVASSNTDQSKQLTNHEGRLSVAETNIKYLERLDAKMDWLIERQGGNPDAIIRPKIDVATTTNQAMR